MSLSASVIGFLLSAQNVGLHPGRSDVSMMEISDEVNFPAFQLLVERMIPFL